jgi:hypothetical protein
MILSGSLLVAARGSAPRVSCRGIGSANGNRTRGLPIQPSPVGSKSLCFQYRWYSWMLLNAATNSRRHSAVTAQTWAGGAHCRRVSEISPSLAFGTFRDPRARVARQNRISGFSDPGAFNGSNLLRTGLRDGRLSLVSVFTERQC